MGIFLNYSVITRNLKGKIDKNKNLCSVANPPPRKSRSDACFMSLELAWLEFNKASSYGYVSKFNNAT